MSHRCDITILRISGCIRSRVVNRLIGLKTTERNVRIFPHKANYTFLALSCVWIGQFVGKGDLAKKLPNVGNHIPVLGLFFSKNRIEDSDREKFVEERKTYHSIDMFNAVLYDVLLAVDVSNELEWEFGCWTTFYSILFQLDSHIQPAFPIYFLRSTFDWLVSADQVYYRQPSR